MALVVGACCVRRTAALVVRRSAIAAPRAGLVARAGASSGAAPFPGALGASEAAALVDFWYAPEARARWFASTPDFDRAVADAWGHGLDVVADADAVGDWAADADLDAVLAHVLLWDQVARHCARARPEDRVGAAGPLAVAAARAALARDLEAVSADRRSFFLLPLRHTRDVAVIEAEVVPRLAAWAAADPRAWRRFERATAKTLLRLKTDDGRPRRTRPAPPTSWSPHAAVLEAAPPFRVDPAPRDRAACARLEAVRAVKRFLRENGAPTVVVSVSGGVDSVVLAYALRRHVAPGTPLVGVHVDYGNRASSRAEAAFVADYCAWLGIPLRPPASVVAFTSTCLSGTTVRSGLRETPRVCRPWVGETFQPT